MVRRVQLSDQVEWPPKQRKRTTWTALGREFITTLCCFTWAVSSQPDSGRHPELPKCTVVGTRSRMARGCRCQRNSNSNNTQFVGGECMGRARVWLVPTRVAGALLAGSLLSQGAFVRPAAAQTCSAAMSTMSSADNLQLGSQVAGPGQRQLRIEADYVTCTQ